jgi:hypothetical protein
MRLRVAFAGSYIAVFAAILLALMSGDAHSWLEAHPHGATPDDAAIATYQLLKALVAMHSLGMSHK